MTQSKLARRFIFLLLTILIPASSLADEYVRVREFRAIHIERDALLKAVSEIFLYVQRVNGKRNQTTGSVKLSRDDYATELDLPIEASDYEKFPRIATSLHMSIYAHSAAVEEVKLWFTDDIRSLEARGNSHDHVTGLIKVVEEKLNFYETYFGGYRSRVGLGALSYLLCMIVVIPNWFHLKERERNIAYYISLILVTIFIYLPPWDRVFPGFLAGSENKSVLERSAPLFTFIGLLFTLVIPIASFAARKRRADQTPKPPVKDDS
jgi:hypothetical protein